MRDARSKSTAGQDEVVSTAAGQLAGVRRSGWTSWLGVPYAAAPVGPLRFRAPQPETPWAGIRPARRSGGAATQDVGPLGSAHRLGATVGEDCLYLNVYAPTAAAIDGRPRPVLVWVHGGAYTSGSGALYDGGPLAEEGDVVVVTVNYRLGVFGFVDLASAVEVDAPSNLGLRDQMAALRWVQQNVAVFGGDPTRVTLAGESAGSISTSMLVASPHTAGLFSAVIMQSGAFTLVHGDETRVEIARHYARILGLGRRDGDRLRQLPATALAAAQRQVNRNTPGTVPASPWFDDDVVPGSLAAAQQAAATRPDLALLAGHNHDELTFFQRLPGDVLPTSRPALTARLRAELGWDRAAEILALYPPTATGTVALGSDLNFAMPTRHFAERHAQAGGPTWCYRLDARGPLGATHAADLVYLWGWTGVAALLLRGRPTRAKSELADRMRQHWLSFVRTGRPRPDWPVFTLDDRATQVFDPAGDRVALDPAGERRRAWAGQDVLPRF